MVYPRDQTVMIGQSFIIFCITRSEGIWYTPGGGGTLLYRKIGNHNIKVFSVTSMTAEMIGPYICEGHDDDRSTLFIMTAGLQFLSKWICASRQTVAVTDAVHNKTAY